MPMPIARPVLPLLAILALASCKGESQKQTAVGAPGELLEGSISDAMIPLDQVKSQAPAAPRVERPVDIDSQQPKVRAADQLLPTDKPAAVAAPSPEAEASTPGEAR